MTLSAIFLTRYTPSFIFRSSKYEYIANWPGQCSPRKKVDVCCDSNEGAGDKFRAHTLKSMTCSSCRPAYRIGQQLREVPSSDLTLITLPSAGSRMVIYPYIPLDIEWWQSQVWSIVNRYHTFHVRVVIVLENPATSRLLLTTVYM